MKLIQILSFAAALAAFVSCANNTALAPSSAEDISLNSAVLGTETEIAPFLAGHRGIFFDVLNVTEEQQAQIQEIVRSHREEMKADHGSPAERPSFEERKARRQQMHEELQGKISGVLTAEQKAKAEELKAQFEQGQIPEEIIDARIARLDAKLNLTEDQKQQIKTLALERPVRGLRGDQKERREFRKERRAAMQEHKEKLFAILTAEQQAILDELYNERREKKHERFQGRREDRVRKRVEHLVAELGLDESQKQQLEELFASLRSELHEVHAPGDRETNRETMREMRKRIDAEIQNILNPEQLEKYNELKASRPERRGHRFGGRRG